MSDLDKASFGNSVRTGLYFGLSTKFPWEGGNGTVSRVTTQFVIPVGTLLRVKLRTHNNCAPRKQE